MNRRDFFRRSAGTAAIPLAAGVAALLPTAATATSRADFASCERLATACDEQYARLAAAALSGINTLATQTDDGQYARIVADAQSYASQVEADTRRALGNALASVRQLRTTA